MPEENENYTNEQLRFALEQSVKLQSHYAHILNMYDSGNRKMFRDANEWIERLKDVSDLRNFASSPTESSAS